ncbi:MAG: SDR family NAD(P)-dependent oxidoreductase [Acidimicrobiales bacterium]
MADTASNRVALVTGASSGIGAATARLLARRGFTVGIVARRRQRLAEVLEDCVAHAPRSRQWVADLSDLVAAAEVARQAWDAFGRIDVLVNNAGVPMRRPVTALTPEEVERVMHVNFFSPVRMTLAVLGRMVERGAGEIVNVSSLAGRLGVTTEAAYSASKFALSGWSEAIAADLAGTGVTVRLILPGTIDTELWDQPDNDPPLYDGPLAPAEDMAMAIADAIDSDHFEHYFPDMKPIIEMKTSDIDGFMAGMVAMAGQRKENR